MITTDCLIVGAGPAGLALGKSLKCKTLILEKSRGVGGRLATRRMGELGLDHGAPYLFQGTEVTELINQLNLDGEIFICPEGVGVKKSMNQIAKKMAHGANVVKSTKVIQIFRSSSNLNWSVQTETGENYEAPLLVITAPLPQALILLDQSHLTYPEELKTISYSKAIMGLFVLTKKDENQKPDLSFSSEVHSVLSMKERELHPRGFVLRMKEKFSEEFFESSREELQEKLRTEFLKGFSHQPEIEEMDLHLWRYVLPLSPYPQPYLEVSKNLFLIGDAFLYPDIRGSLHGAKLLAQKLSSGIINSWEKNSD